MKKAGLLALFFLLVISFLSLASAINIASKENYLPYETLLVKISGDIQKNIASEDITFYNGYREIPVDYNIANLNGDYYLYALLPGEEGNYTFQIANISYIQSRVTKKETFNINFTISGNATVQVSPGFIIASETFSIYLENFGESGEFKAELFSQKYPITILENDASTVYFSLPEDESFGYIEIYSGSKKIYEIPAKILHPSNASIDETQFAFKDREINATLSIDNPWIFTLELFNYGSFDIGDVSLSVIDLEDYVSIDPEIVTISPGTPALINLSIESDSVGLKQGYIQAEYDGIITNVSLNLAFTQNTSSSPITDSETSSCQGRICPSNTKCSLQEYSIGVANCCPGVCEEPVGSSSGWLIGIIIIIAVIIVGAGIFYFVKKKSFSGDVVREQSDKYDNIMRGR